MAEKRKLEAPFLPMCEVDDTIISNVKPPLSIPLNKFTLFMGVLMVLSVYVVWNNLVNVESNGVLLLTSKATISLWVESVVKTKLESAF